MSRRPARGDDRGAGTSEMLGVVVVAALLVTGVIGGLSSYPDRLAAQLCKLTAAATGASDASCGSAPVAEVPTDEDYLPGSWCRSSPTAPCAPR